MWFSFEGEVSTYVLRKQPGAGGVLGPDATMITTLWPALSQNVRTVLKMCAIAVKDMGGYGTYQVALVEIVIHVASHGTRSLSSDKSSPPFLHVASTTHSTFRLS